MVDERDRPPNRADSTQRWHPHLSRAAMWLVGAVLTAAIGLIVPAFLTDWLSNGDEQESGRRAQESSPTPAKPAIPSPNSSARSASGCIWWRRTAAPQGRPRHSASRERVTEVAPNAR